MEDHGHDGSAVGEPLRGFLVAEDLNALSASRARLGEPSASDHTSIRRLLADGEDQRAVENLLLYPSLIPADIRFDTVLAGLGQSPSSYAALAAVVGLDEMDVESVAEADRRKLLARLLELIDDGPPVVARRASVAILPLLSTADVAPVVRTLERADDVVAHNLLYALCERVEPDVIQSVLVQTGGITDDTRERVRQAVRELGNRELPGRATIAAMPLYEPIPDRGEWHVP